MKTTKKEKENLFSADTAENSTNSDNFTSTDGLKQRHPAIKLEEQNNNKK